MNRRVLSFILCAAMVFLWGCGVQTAVDDRIQVSLVETPGCTVENNGQWVRPGEDVVFRLTMDEHTSLAGTDYDGDSATQIREGRLELTLKAVRYPVRVSLELTQDFCTIVYDPNGGDGSATEISYDLRRHLRPNTENGQDLFTREGHTLVCWNTEPDGSGTRVGLGSRVTVEGSLTLYAQWAKWAPESDFQYQITNYDTVNIRGYLGSDETLVIPAYIEGKKVTALMPDSFRDSQVRQVVVPPTVERIASEAFADCKALESIVLHDNLHMIYDASFVGCDSLQTLYINAVEAPWGYDYRKESVYPDKIDLLILAQGQRKMVFYGGCSVWYNLDGSLADQAFGTEYQILNMGLNGTVNSAVQMQILEHYLESGDLFVHTLEVSSRWQMMQDLTLTKGDDKLWCGLEYNYDLFSLVDLRTVSGVFESWLNYLDLKKTETEYRDRYTDSKGHTYLDGYGGIPFLREETKDNLTDQVRLDASYVTQAGMDTLEQYYQRYQDLGVRIYVSYACVNMDEVPQEEQENVELIHSLVAQYIEAMDGPVLISQLSDFLYVHEDFYDTNYHLLTEKTKENTALWLRDLKARMILDGIWEDTE